MPWQPLARIPKKRRLWSSLQTAKAAAAAGVIDEKDLDLNKLFVQLLGAKNICSRRPVYNKYDKNVQGNTILEAGEADAG